jgi:hypothetical protein
MRVLHSVGWQLGKAFDRFGPEVLAAFRNPASTQSTPLAKLIAPMMRAMCLELAAALVAGTGQP